jgi:tetratricopeptide (TPR) repeat protein
VLTLSIGRLDAPPVLAQTPAPVYVPIALAPVQRDTPFELVALTLDANISESNGHTLVSGNSTFKIHNTDLTNDLQLPVGFPTWAGDPYTFDPTQVSNFAVTIDGQKVRTLNPAHTDIQIGSAVRAVDWYTFTLSLAADEKKTVRFDFAQDLGDGAVPRFTYGLLPATNWKGSIGSARLTLQFPKTTTLEQIVSADPANPDFDGTSVTWHFTNKEPPANPALTFLRPSVWDDLNVKRTAAQQNQTDPNARAALGKLLGQLASIDTQRSDTLYAQAVAELESAVRLDPNQTSAREALASLYESRAGPPAGPRQPAYVLLAAAEWQALQAANAGARKQLAEDDFYLGLDAQTRLEFAQAANYYDKAETLAPDGAGPLYTADRAAAQRRALNVAWARALLSQNDAAQAEDKARAAFGDTFMTSYTAPSWYVTRARVEMLSGERVMTFAVEPYGAAPAEVATAISSTATQMHEVGADASFDSSGSELSIRVPFGDRAQLTDRLAGLAQTLPDGPEWALVRSVLSPKSVDWLDQDQLVSHAASWNEEIDLAPACDDFSSEIDSISKQLDPLTGAPTADEEAQLKRALLDNAQTGWRDALAQGQVVYTLAGNTQNVEPCTARAISLSASSPLTLRLAFVAAIFAVVAVGAIGIVAVLWTRRRRRKA